ncbi:hypothetical protein BgiBS90_017427, partial [Biomphalaria glabrata]
REAATFNLKAIPYLNLILPSQDHFTSRDVVSRTARLSLHGKTISDDQCPPGFTRLAHQSGGM